MKEAVNHPDHYNVGKIEVIDAIEDWGLNFCEGNVVKYVARHRHKNEPLEDLEKAKSMLPEGWPVLPVSAKTGQGIEEMKDFIFDNLNFMSIYLKPQGQEADLVEPLIVKNTSTVRDVCVKLHRDFERKFRYARVKGPSAKFDWQRVGLDHLLMDEDLLTIIVRK